MIKRVLAGILVVSVLTQTAAPVLAQQSNVATVTITSMDRGSVRPFDQLVITGSGFQPEAAAISVLFTPRQHGSPIVVPAFSANATEVKVVVPAFLDAATGDFGFGQADVQVIQVTANHVMSSNVLSGLDVAPVPTLPASVAAGRVTSAFMRLSLEFIDAGTSAADPANRAALMTFKAEQAALVAKIESVVANPATVSFATSVDGTSFVVNRAMLAASDRLIAAYLTSIVPLIDTQHYGPSDLATNADEDCSSDLGVRALDEIYCWFRPAVLRASRTWVTGALLVTGGLSVLFVMGHAIPVGLVAAASLALVLGVAQLGYLFMSSAFVAHMRSPDALPVMTSLRDQAGKMLDDVRARGRTAVTSAWVQGTAAVSQVAATVGTAPSTAPAGGTTVAAPGINPAAAIREMTTFQGAGSATVATVIGVPATQATRTFAEARIVQPNVNVFDGAYTGTINWTATGVTPSGSFSLAFSIAGGTVTVTDPSGGSGSITAAGGIVFSSGPCGFAGGVDARTATSAAVAGGTMAACVLNNETGSGYWSAERAARP